MLIIKTPASSANLSIGFDTLGLALNLYNEFHIEDSETMIFDGFQEFIEDTDNLFLYAYTKFYQVYVKNELMKHVKCTLVKNEIPISRGLGSSASMILAGVFAANEIHKTGISFDTCVNFSAMIEGHSDNVFACAYGKLTASTYLDDAYYHQTYDVDSRYKFYILIPNQKGSTKVSRSLLPDKVRLEDAVNNLSKIIMLPALFKTYDFDTLKKVMTDKLHEPYRYPYIPLYSDIKSASKNENQILMISGSGPSVLMISKVDQINLLDLDQMYKVKKVEVCGGLTVEVDK
jgi:homoserine kinase